MLRNVFQSKKRKLKKKVIENDQEQASSNFDQFLQSTPEEPNIDQKEHRSAEGLRKALQQISVALDEQKEARAALEDKVTALYRRNMDRQNQFRKILHENIPYCQGQTKNIDIQSLWKIKEKMIVFFDENNDKMDKKLEQQGKDLQGIMQRKVYQLTQRMQTQLEKTKKLLKMNYEAIRKQIKQMIRLSSIILDENDEYRSKLKQHVVKNQLLKSQKSLLLAENIEKKDLILKMFKQLRNKAQKDDARLVEVNQLKRQRRQIEDQYQLYEQQIKQKMDNNQRSRPMSIHYGREDHFVKTASNKKRRDDTYQSHQSTVGTRAGQYRDQNRKRFVTLQGKNNEFSSSHTTTFHLKKMITVGSQFEDARPNPNMSQLKQIIIQLKQTIRNEKKKNFELIKKMNQYHVCQQEMNQFIKEYFSLDEEDVKGTPLQSHTNLKILKNADKIHQMVKELVRRLMSSSNPAVNGGYNDIQTIMSEFKQDVIN